MAAGADRAAWRLTPRARGDIEDIWRHSATAFGSQQAERYVAGLMEAIQLLARTPEMARQRDEFEPPVRLHPYCSHLIIYRIEAGHILIVRVLHGREDWLALAAEPGPEPAD